MTNSLRHTPGLGSRVSGLGQVSGRSVMDDTKMAVHNDVRVQVSGRSKQGTYELITSAARIEGSSSLVVHRFLHSRSIRASSAMGQEEPYAMDLDPRVELKKEERCGFFLDGFRPEYLRIYYGRLFPYAEMFKWLSYGHDGKHPGCDSSYIGRREISFTLENDIYVRYLSFHDAAEMEATIREKCPHKIDIGAVYNVDPAKRTAYAGGSDRVFAPVDRELVFDILRLCHSPFGQDGNFLWTFYNRSYATVDALQLLAEDFGFEHLLWVYSGRRGVHCWVCDARARRLTNDMRTAITKYLTLYKGNENNTKKVSLTGPCLHPSLSRAYEICKVYFEEQMLPNQTLLCPEGHFEKVLELVPDESVRAQMRDRWQENRRASTAKDDINATRWRQLKHTLESKQRAPSVRRSMEEIVFSYTYPRLDLEVSKHMNHLLKAPFCVHPKTGRVCVPIDPQDCDNFDPTTVPTLSQLLNELNQNEEGGEGPKTRDLEKTSLGRSVHIFQTKFLDPLLRTSKAAITAAHQEKLHAAAAKPTLNW